MTDHEHLLQLVALKFETKHPDKVMIEMGPSWRAEAMRRLREAVEAGSTVTIETLWGPPNHPLTWNLSDAAPTSARKGRGPSSR